ncbi:MAG TPA: ABC transporter substrate-binding protein [Trebonia sp.]|jgi:NitT/TauT family transport system substrate-binding protein
MIEETVSRRTLLRGGMMMGAAGLLAACSSGGGSTKTANGASVTGMTAGWSTASGGCGPLWVGVDQGIFKKYGLNVSPVESGSTASAAAVVAGKSQIYYGEATSAFQAVTQGQPLQIVATFRDYGLFYFMTGPGITSAAQLKGKPIAISSVGDSTDLSTRNALATLGIPVSDVTLLATGTSDAREAALLTGKVAATLLTNPTADEAVAKGCKILVDQTKQLFVGSAVIIDKSYGQQNPDATVNFLKGMVEAVKFMDDPSNKQAVLTTFAKYFELKTTDPTLVANYTLYAKPGALSRDPYPSVGGGNAIISALKSENASQYASLTLDQVYDYTYAQKLRSSGFLTSVWGNQLNVGSSPSAS